MVAYEVAAVRPLRRRDARSRCALLALVFGAAPDGRRRRRRAAQPATALDVAAFAAEPQGARLPALPRVRPLDAALRARVQSRERRATSSCPSTCSPARARRRRLPRRARGRVVHRLRVVRRRRGARPSRPSASSVCDVPDGGPVMRGALSGRAASLRLVARPALGALAGCAVLRADAGRAATTWPTTAPFASRPTRACASPRRSATSSAIPGGAWADEVRAAFDDGGAGLLRAREDVADARARVPRRPSARPPRRRGPALLVALRRARGRRRDASSSSRTRAGRRRCSTHASLQRRRRVGEVDPRGASRRSLDPEHVGRAARSRCPPSLRRALRGGCAAARGAARPRASRARRLLLRPADAARRPQSRVADARASRSCLERGRVAQGARRGEDLFVRWDGGHARCARCDPTERGRPRSSPSRHVADVLAGALEATLPRGAVRRAPRAARARSWSRALRRLERRRREWARAPGTSTRHRRRRAREPEAQVRSDACAHAPEWDRRRSGLHDPVHPRPRSPHRAAAASPVRHPRRDRGPRRHGA